MIHLTHCRNAPPTASDAEMRELARRLERGDNDGMVPYAMRPVHIGAGSRNADIVIEALRRCAGPARE